MRTQREAHQRLALLLSQGPRTKASILETMRPEGYTSDQIEQAAMDLRVVSIMIGPTKRNSQHGWRLP